MKKVLLTFLSICVFSFSLSYIYAVNSKDYGSSYITIDDTKLTQQQAREILIRYDSNIDYIYKGNSKEIKSLSEKGLEGYLFSPTKPTEIKYFVDKNSSEIYILYPNEKIERLN